MLLPSPTGQTATVLTFAVPSGTTTDSYGQTVPGVVTAALTVILHRLRNQVSETPLPGTNINEIALSGRVVDATTNYRFPATIRALTNPVVSGTYNGKAGRFEIHIPGENPYGASAVVGERFYARFSPD